MQVVQALEALLTVIHGHDNFEKLLCGDNSSAISILTKPDGPWRTRHLRLRSHGLREKLSSQKGDWKLRHQKGTELIADFLTKPITVPGEWKRFSSFVGLEGIETPADKVGEDSQGIGRVPEKEGSTLGGSLRVAKLGVLMAIMGKLANVDGEVGSSMNVKALLVALMTAFVVRCWELCRSVSPSRLRNWFSEVHQNLDNHVDESNFEGWVEENQIRAKGHQERQEARGDEPALSMVREYEPTIAKMGFLREDEPRFPIQLREDEPGWISEDPSCDVDELEGEDFSYPLKVSEGHLNGRCGMRVTASVAGPDLKLDGDRISLPQVDRDELAILTTALRAARGERLPRPSVGSPWRNIKEVVKCL